MKDYRKAIETLKVRSKFVAEVNLDAIVAYNLAIETLEKEIPKLPITHTDNEFTDADSNKGMEVHYVECPNCGGELFTDYTYNRCDDCGQVID